MDELRKKVREKLVTNGLTTKWLTQQLRTRGIDVQYNNLSSAMSGTRSGATAEGWLFESLKVLNAYEIAAPAWQQR